MSKLWSYKKPTEPGWYHVNLGDVVTKDHHEVCLFELDKGELYVVNTEDMADCVPVSKWNSSCKFLPIDYEYLNKIGNE